MIDSNIFVLNSKQKISFGYTNSNGNYSEKIGYVHEVSKNYVMVIEEGRQIPFPYRKDKMNNVVIFLN